MSIKTWVAVLCFVGVSQSSWAQPTVEEVEGFYAAAMEMSEQMSGSPEVVRRASIRLLVANLEAQERELLIDLVSLEEDLVSEDFKEGVLEAFSHIAFDFSLELLRRQVDQNDADSRKRESFLIDVLAHQGQCMGGDLQMLLDAVTPWLEDVESPEAVVAMSVLLESFASKILFKQEIKFTPEQLAFIRKSLDAQQSSVRLAGVFLLVGAKDSEVLVEKLKHKTVLSQKSLVPGAKVYPLSTQCIIAEGLGRIGGDECLDILAAKLNPVSNAAVPLRLASLRGLAEGVAAKNFDTNEVSPLMMELVSDKNEEMLIRASALGYLGAQGDADDLEGLRILEKAVVADEEGDSILLMLIQMTIEQIELRLEAIDKPKPGDDVWGFLLQDSAEMASLVVREVPSL